MDQPATSENGGLFGGRLFVFNALPSTNQWLLDHVAACADGDAVLARSQTAGRGRFQRPWITPAGKALALSVLLKPHPERARLLPLFGPAAALAVRRVLDDAGLPARVKWPNDVLVAGRKIAGILAERESETGAIVVGMGVNVNLAVADFGSGLLHPATSMLLETGEPSDVDAVGRAVLAGLQALLIRVQAGGAAIVAEEWARHDALTGKPIRVCTAQGTVAGRYAGMATSGELLLTDGSGQERRFWSGDVSLL